MNEILSRESVYDRVIVVRSAVPSREQGFLPGELEEKEHVYQLPYEAIFKEIFPPNGTPIMEKLKDQKLYSFTSTSYLRGMTFHKAIIIVDEVQNMDFHELCTVITRLGDDCKVIFCGDFRQSDLHKQAEREGLHNFMRILDKMEEFSHVEFKVEDIVRSGLVKSFIQTQVRLGLM
jgi:phosphate starvation-inducible PhoH-like protein